MSDADQVEIPGVAAAAPAAPRYRKGQKEYAEFYNQSDRTIKRWVARGRDGNDPPPLDDPVAMVAWWAKHFSHKCPDCILEAARQSAPARPAAPPAFSRPAAPIEEGDPVEVGTGFREMLERVKRAEAEAYQEYNKALKANDESRLASTRKQWSELSKQLRELERDAPDILSRSGGMVEKSAVEKVIAEIHGPIINGVRSMWRRIRSRMMTTPENQQDGVWQAECDRLFARLNESAFTAHE